MKPYKLTILRKKVKYLRIRIEDADTVIATAPLRIPLSQIEDFLLRRETRIRKKREKLQVYGVFIDLQPDQILLHGKAYTFIHFPQQEKKYHVDHKMQTITRWYDLLNLENRKQRYTTYAKHMLTRRLDQLSHKHALPYERCFIRDQKTKWWTCSSKRHIGLNRRLVKMPMFISDYIICHELAHLKHMNHSRDFWDFCTELFPETMKARAWLKKWGNAMR